MFLTPLLYHLPQSVLAAVIMMAVVGLINIKAIRHAWEAHKHGGVAAIVTFIATLTFAPHLDNGIMVGAGLAIVLFLYRTMKPRVALLGRFGDGTLRDLQVHPTLPTDERIIVVRFDGQLYFANGSYFEDTVLAAVADHPNAKFLLVVADGINQLDASGQEVLEHIIDRLGANAITTVLSGMKRQAVQVLHRTHLAEAGTSDQPPLERPIRIEAAARLQALLDRVAPKLTLRGLLRLLTGEDLTDQIRPQLVRHLATGLDEDLAAWWDCHPRRGPSPPWRTGRPGAMGARGAWRRVRSRGWPRTTATAERYQDRPSPFLPAVQPCCGCPVPRLGELTGRKARPRPSKNRTKNSNKIRRVV